MLACAQDRYQAEPADLSVPASGDVNRNDIPYDLGDAMVFNQYFIYGLPAFRINVAEQIAATDVNCDGYTLSVADLVMLQQIIAGYQEPPPCGE